MAEREYSKDNLRNKQKVASKVSSRIDTMHNKDMKKECNRGEKELRAATKLF